MEGGSGDLKMSSILYELLNKNLNKMDNLTIIIYLISKNMVH